MKNPSQKFIINPGGKLQGTIRVPGDKSISHRAIMLGALAENTTTINGFLAGEDTLATLAAFQTMGVPIKNHNMDKSSYQALDCMACKCQISPYI
ncbi:3-phosphoshikimate 1-carboxyvinyltransferase [Beggiatoa sp. PS]|nr:3-phosphoshikimate 1-carboxyvinyltransferase [Beggiatoa sp. PS]